MNDSIRENLESIRARMAAAARRSGRHPSAVKLLAVTKDVPAERVKTAVACGQLLFGENYVQEARAKIPQLGQPLCWHFIGRLQSNKIKPAAELFSVIETIDRLELAQGLNKNLASLGRSIDIFIQVNIGRERQKAGVMPEQTAELLRAIDTLAHLKAIGLMAIPPLTVGPEMARAYFRQLREMADDLSVQGLLGHHGPVELSMGMSEDFEIAIEEGATLVRVGTAIFGSRKRHHQI